MIEGLFSSENYALAGKLLDAAHLRQQALAANVANVNTPGYKRVDISADFNAQLQDALRTGPSEIKTLKPTLQVDTFSEATRADGNNVALDKELLELNKNSLAYQFLTDRVSGSIKSLKMAITGKSS
jgi:flagellar basal-body rod protein FlgB